MLLTIFFIILTIIFIAGFLLNPREKRENGCHLLVLACVFLQIVIGAAAAVISCLGAAVNLKNICVALVFIDAFLAVRIIWKRRVAQLDWRLVDAISLVVCVGMIVALSLWNFGSTLELTYNTLDAARYMQEAMKVLNTGTISAQYLTPLMQALTIAACRPFLLSVSYYKAMILSHILMQMLSICMFYVLLSEVNKAKRGRWANIIFTVLFWAGLQLYYSTGGTFIQSMNGAVFAMLMLYYTIRLQRNEIVWLRGCGALIAALFGMVVGYPFFLMMVVPMIAPEAVIWIKNNIKRMSIVTRIFLLGAAAAAVLIGLAFSAQRVGKSASAFLVALQLEGAIYREPYMDFIFFIPVLLGYIFLLRRKKEESWAVLRMNLIAVGFIVFWFVLYMNGYLSFYYYYRMYYILWLMAWVMTADAFRLALQEKYFGGITIYAATYGLAVLSSVLGLNDALEQAKPEIYSDSGAGGALCPLYKTNYDTLTDKSHEVVSIFSQSEFQLYDYVIEEMEGETVDAVHSVYSAVKMMWYQGITWVGRTDANGTHDLSDACLMTIARDLDNFGIKYILISKEDQDCMQYYTDVFSQAELVMENASGYILSIGDGTWTDLIYNIDTITSEQRELYTFVYENYDISSVYLICEGWLSDEITAYSIYAGTGSTGYAGSIWAEDFISQTYQFNIDEVEYMTVLKDSWMYEENQEYFDAQEILFENEAGMVLTHAGTGWMPSEQE